MTRNPDNDAQVEQLVSEHLYLVQHIVHELAVRYPRHVDRQELWSAGATGLVEAARRFDVGSEVPFAHYARRRIRGAILDSTRQRDWATRGVRRDQRTLTNAASSFEQRHQRVATDEELAHQLGVDHEEIARRRAAAHRGTVLHLDQPLTTGADAGTASLADTIATEDVDVSPEASLEQRELLGALRTAVRHLTDVQRDVIERYYLKGERLRDVAEEMGVTEARVSQLRAEAVRALQTYLQTAEYGTVDVDDDAPGKRQRAAFVARVTENSTWRQRLDAADQPIWQDARAVTA
ncbi:MAG: sigma-70 family RNA polymerase sigma factor [Actinobacteria bacterium]|nr:sigma-70 family RNA polymerase sigma factor [Actinomycetota bacterium]